MEEKPLILTDEVVEKKTSNEKLENTTPKPNLENQILSPAVRKIVAEKKIDINSSKRIWKRWKSFKRGSY